MRVTRFGQYELIEDGSKLTYRLTPGTVRLYAFAMFLFGNLGLFVAAGLLMFRPLSRLDPSYGTVESVVVDVSLFVAALCFIGYLFRRSLVTKPIVIDTSSRLVGGVTRIEDVESIGTRMISNAESQPSYEVIFNLRTSSKPMVYLSLNSQYDANGVAGVVSSLTGVPLR